MAGNRGFFSFVRSILVALCVTFAVNSAWAYVRINVDNDGGTGGITSLEYDCGDEAMPFDINGRWYDYDATLPSSVLPTKTGYTFDGYYDSEYGTEWVNDGGTLDGGLVLATTHNSICANGSTGEWDAGYVYAEWIPNTYTVTYAGMDGATHGANHPTSATFDTAFTVNNPTKTGYTFAGWNITGMDSVTHTYGSSTTTNTSISGTKATSFKNLRSTSGTVTFTATWTAKSITCSAGYYLPANSETCTACPAGRYCLGGTFTYTGAEKGNTGQISAGYFSTGGAKKAAPNTTVGGTNGTGSNGCLSGYTCGAVSGGYFSTGGGTKAAPNTTNGGESGNGNNGCLSGKSCGAVSAGYFSTGGGTKAAPTSAGNGCISGKSCGAVSGGYYSTGGAYSSMPTSAGNGCISGKSCGQVYRGYYSSGGATISTPTSSSHSVISGATIGKCISGYTTATAGKTTYRYCYRREETTCAAAIGGITGVSNGSTVFKTIDGSASPSTVYCNRFQSSTTTASSYCQTEIPSQCIPTGVTCDTGYKSTGSALFSGLDANTSPVYGNGRQYSENNLGEGEMSYRTSDGNLIRLYVRASTSSGNSSGSMASTISTTQGGHCWVKLLAYESSSTGNIPAVTDWIYIGNAGVSEDCPDMASYYLRNDSGVTNTMVSYHTGYTCTATSSYAVSLNTNNGDTVSPSTVYTRYGAGVYSSLSGAQNMTSNLKITKLTTVPKKENYSFIGFYNTSSTGGTQMTDSLGNFTSNATNNTNTTWYAQWQPLYTLTFDKDGGTGGTDAYYFNSNGLYIDQYGASSARGGTGLYSFVAPSKTGYTFNGYYLDSDLTNQILTSDGGYASSWIHSFDSYYNSNVTLYAKWTAKSITCSAGYYLPANSETCTACPAGYYCNGGTFTYNGNMQGRTGTLYAGYFSTGGATKAAPNTTVGGTNGTGNNGCLSGYTCGAVSAGYFSTGGATRATPNNNIGGVAGNGSNGCLSGRKCGLVSAGYYSTGGGTSSNPSSNGSGCTSTGTTCGKVAKGYYSAGGAKVATPTSSSDSASGATSGQCLTDFSTESTGATSYTACHKTETITCPNIAKSSYYYTTDGFDYIGFPAPATPNTVTRHSSQDSASTYTYTIIGLETCFVRGLSLSCDEGYSQNIEKPADLSSFGTLSPRSVEYGNSSTAGLGWFHIDGTSVEIFGMSVGYNTGAASIGASGDIDVNAIFSAGQNGTTPDTYLGADCWCKVDTIGDYRGGGAYNMLPITGEWVYAGAATNNSPDNCSELCAESFSNSNSALYSTLFGSNNSLNEYSCTPNTYTVTYAGMNGATHGASHPTSATFDTAFTVNNPTKTGYTFAGWDITGMDSVTHTYGSSTTTNTSISGTTATSFKNLRSTSGTVTFTATWEPNTFTVTYAGNSNTSGSVPSNHTCSYDGTCTAGAQGTLLKTNATFGGWTVSCKKADGTTACTPSVQTIAAGGSLQNVTAEPGATITLTAIWNNCACGTDTRATCAVSGVTNNVCQYTHTCDTGSYHSNNGTPISNNSLTCTLCPAGYRDGAGASAQSNCETTCSAGTQVAARYNACSTPQGDSWYTPAHNVKYGATSGTNVKSCATGYNTANTTTATDHDAENDCKISCGAGTWVESARSTCVSVEDGYYTPTSQTISQGSIGSRSACSQLASEYVHSDNGRDATTDCFLYTWAKKYVATEKSNQVDCTEDAYCPGGVQVHYGNTGGRTACDTGLFAPAKSYRSEQCGHKFHVDGANFNDVFYLHSDKVTTPSFNVRWNNKTWYANMTEIPTNMSIDSSHKFKASYGGKTYHICDDTICDPNNDFTQLINVDGDSYGYLTADGNHSQNATGLSNGEWTVTWNDYGTVRGTSMCSTTSGAYAQTGNPSNTEGKYCWCKMTGFTGTDGIATPAASLWVSSLTLSSASVCAGNCAYLCGTYVRSHSDMRSGVFGSVQN